MLAPLHLLVPLIAIFFSLAPANEVFAVALKEITEKDDTKTIQVVAKDTIVVTLPSQLATGYSWTVTVIDKKLLKLAGDPKHEDSDPKKGKTECQVFRFEALATGRSELKLEYKRPFGDMKPAKKFSVTIEAK
jgi:predicted secreted protein